VVPVAGQPVAGPLVEADDVVRPAAVAGQGEESVLAHVGQLGEGGDQRGLGGGVLGDRTEDARVVPQGPAQRGGDDRRRHRAATGRGQRWGPEQLGQPISGEERHGRHPGPGARPQPPGGQDPSGGHADVVAGHDDADRGQRIAALGGGYGGAQPLQRGTAVGSRQDLEGHSRKGTHGV
jgi:hypothetical protein